MPQTLELQTYTKVDKNISDGTFAFETTYSSEFYPNILRCKIAENEILYNDKRGVEGYLFVELRRDSANLYYDDLTGELILEETNSENEYSVDEFNGDIYAILEETGFNTFYWYVKTTGDLDYY